MASLSIVSPNPNPTVVFNEPLSLDMFSSGTDCSEVTIELKNVTASSTGTDVPNARNVVVMQSVLDPDTATIYIPARTLDNNQLYRLKASKTVKTMIYATVYLDTR